MGNPDGQAGALGKTGNAGLMFQRTEFGKAGAVIGSKTLRIETTAHLEKSAHFAFGAKTLSRLNNYSGA